MSTPLRSRWLDWPEEKNRADMRTDRTAKTVERSEQGAFVGFGGSRCKSAPGLFAKGRLDLADVLALIDDMHSWIRADYTPGALSLLDLDADLRRRFDATEGRIDNLAREPGGPVEADFRAAIEAHAAVWREIIGRHRAHQEQQAERADPMPELPVDAVAAVGVSFGDGAPGTWDVLREGRWR